MLNSFMRDVTWRDELVTGPSAEDIRDLLDAEELLDQHLRVVNDGADLAYVERLCRTVYAYSERYTHRAILPQTRRCVLDSGPVGAVVLTYPPVLTVESFEYLDGDGVYRTWDAANYRVSLPTGPQAAPGRVAPVSGVIWPALTWPPSAATQWPSTLVSQADGVRVTYTAGYVTADSPAQLDVPEDLRHGMLLLLEELYTRRGLSVQGPQTPNVLGAHALFDRYRVG